MSEKRTRGERNVSWASREAGRKGGEDHGANEAEERLAELLIPVPRELFRRMRTTPAECLKLWLALFELGWRIDTYETGHTTAAIADCAGVGTALTEALLADSSLSPHIERHEGRWRLKAPPLLPE